MPDAAQTNLKEKVRRLPHKPGVYLMKDRLGETIYVGKAKDLKKRVASYFQPSRKLLIAQPKVRAMVDLIHDFETHQVKSEAEALLLEGRMIKKYRPRYNTDFTDDKRFLLVRVDPTETLPRFRLTRNRVDNNSRYYGPFAHSGHLRKTLAELRRRNIFKVAAAYAAASASCSATPARSISATAAGASTTTRAPKSTATPTRSPKRTTANAWKPPANSSKARPANGWANSASKWPPPPKTANTKKPPPCAT